MEQEKIIQVAVAECEDSTTYVALTNTSRIFRMIPTYNGSKVIQIWKELPCPLTKPEPTSEDVL